MKVTLLWAVLVGMCATLAQAGKRQELIIQKQAAMLVQETLEHMTDAELGGIIRESLEAAKQAEEMKLKQQFAMASRFLKSSGLPELSGPGIDMIKERAMGYANDPA